MSLERRIACRWIIAVILGLFGVIGGALAGESWTVSRFASPASGELRGFGSVSVERLTFSTESGRQVWVSVFSCQNGEKANVLIGKFLADLELSTGVTNVPVTCNAGVLPATQTGSGAIILGSILGAAGRVVAAPDPVTLTAFLDAHPEFAKGVVAAAAYPAFLDRFDRYGWGAYGMGGFSNFHDWMTRADGTPTRKDPTEDVAFMITNRFRFEPWLDPAVLDNSDGIPKNTESEWMTKVLSEAGMPYSFRVYGAHGGADWTARRFAEYLEQPAEWMMCGWLRPMLGEKSAPHLTWFDADIHRFLAARTMSLMQPYAEDPLNMGWMHPHGELEHQPWYDRHDDYSPRAMRHWRDYLQQQGLSLADVSVLYGRTRQPFADWEQVAIPEFATFAGLEGMIESLHGTWFYRRGRSSNDMKDANFPGLAEGWYKEPLDLAKWQMVTGVPGSDRMYEVLDERKVGRYGTTWFRRTVTLPQSSISNLQSSIFLYWFPMTQSGVHSGTNAIYHKVFINGEAAGEIGSWGALDVRKFLKAGPNEIAMQLIGPYWQGRAFLSTEKPAVYPYLGQARNRLFLLWQDWHVNAKYAAWATILDGMRQVDPNRPIKFMAPLKFGASRWLTLARDWGGFGHFTGEGMWYFPWYKRYGFLYDVPGSSEMGQPAGTLPEMFATFRRTFLAGLNAHDPVFVAQTYTRPPEMRTWWESHNPVLKRMGKYDISPDTAPQVLLYRSSHGTERLLAPAPYPELGESTRIIQNGWNWDLGRGTLQTLGHSMLYLDDRGMIDGKMNGFPLMIDSGNETIAESSLAAIEAWVKAGGTFITLPFSGRNTELEPDTWTITRLTGCKVGKLREVGKGEVTIGKDQRVFKDLAGRTFPDAGVSADWVGNNLNLYSVELEPGPDGEVLATYENGAPAIVRRPLGEGAVIALGSAFWRHCADRTGIWWPEPIETEFLADLLAGVNFAPAVCTTDDRLVWAQPYRSNNGFDAVTCLVSWHDDQDVDVTVRLRLPRKPTRLVSHGVDGQRELAFEWLDGVATAKIHMPAKEVKVIDAAVHTPDEAIAHWWHYQQKMWHSLKEPAIDFSPYRQGKWADPTLDLRQGGAAFSMTDPATGNTTWTDCPVSILNFWGAVSNQPVWLRKTFRVPQAWTDRGGRIFLVSGAYDGSQYEGSARLMLNGTMLHDFVGANYRQKDFDITQLIHENENELMLAFKGDSTYQGVKGQLYLYHWTPPARRIELGGEWDAEDAEGKPTGASVPGGIKAWNLNRTVFIPEEWRGRYQIRLYLEGNPHATTGAYVNDRLVRRHHHTFDTVGDLDITRFLRFGEDNHLNLLHVYGGGTRDPKQPPHWDLRTVELHLHEE